MMTEIPEPIEDVDFFVIKRVRYELHVVGTFFVTADEECDDFEVDAARIDLSAPMVVGTTVVGCEERRIDDPTKRFDRDAWTLAKRIELGDKVRPANKPMPSDMKRGYFVLCDIPDGIGFAVVATSEAEAKSLAWNADDDDWRRKDVECHIMPSANIDGLPIGMVADERDALRRGLYDSLQECECDECGQDGDVTCYEGRILCEACIFDARLGEADEDI